MTERRNEMAHVSEYVEDALKRTQWEEIKTRSPELAEFLKTVKEKFGKPQHVEVRFK